MKKIRLLFLASVLPGALGLAQTSPDAATQTPNTTQSQPLHMAAGTVIPAELSKTVDAKKSKPGDKVEAKISMDMLSKGQVVIPRNTKIFGHITEAKAHSKESPDSMVGIVFDRIAMKSGQEVTLQAGIQAIGRPLRSANYAGAMNESGGMPAAGTTNPSNPMGGGPAGPPPGSLPAGNSSQAAAPLTDTVAPLAPNSQGVVGLGGLTLNSTGQASVVSSSDSNVHLENGTQLILRTQ